jgi:hypothetical protein
MAQQVYIEHVISPTQSVPVANSPITLPKTQTSYTLNGLRSGSNYRVRIVAENAIGQGPMSNLLQAYTDDSVADAPTNLAQDNFIETDETQIALAWSEGAWNGGQEVTGYRVTYGGQTLEVTEPFVTLTGLNANTAYTIGVEAINS